MSNPVSAPPLSGNEARLAARNAGAIAIARILSSAALFGWQLVLGRLLGESEFGVYGTIGALISIGAVITGFGLSLIVIRDVARRPQDAGRYLTAALGLHTVLALAAYLGMNALAWALGYSADLRALAAVALLALYTDILGTVAFDQLIARERMVATSAVEVGNVLTRIAAGALVLALGGGLMGLYAVTLLTSVARAAALWALMLRAGVRPRWPFERVIARPLFINALPLALGGIVNIAYIQIDKLMSTSLLGAAQTGFLTAASVIVAGVVEILSTTILTALFPLMSRLYAPGRDPEPFYFMVRKLAFFTLLIGLPVALTFTVFAEAITVPLFGANFRPAAQVLRVFIWYAALTMVVNVFSQALMVQNRQRRYVGMRVGGLAFKLALNLLLMPLIGVTGAAVASVIAEAAVLAGVASAFPLGWRVMLPRLLRVALAALVSLVAMLLLGALAPILGIVAGPLVFGAAALLLGALAPDDLDLLYRLAAALPGGGFIRRVWKRDVVVTWE
jgi:O-antigen/teichoic acid export membrane protein